jgi:hypothetical protein
MLQLLGSGCQEHTEVAVLQQLVCCCCWWCWCTACSANSQCWSSILPQIYLCKVSAGIPAYTHNTSMCGLVSDLRHHISCSMACTCTTSPHLLERAFPTKSCCLHATPHAQINPETHQRLCACTAFKVHRSLQCRHREWAAAGTPAHEAAGSTAAACRVAAGSNPASNSSSSSSCHIGC